jgi:hypothetical protein
MAHTHNQDLEACFNTLHSNFTETQQEVRQFSANIATINKNMHSSINASIDELKEDITTQLEYVTTMIYTKLHISADLSLSDPPLHTKGETSSNSQNFQRHHFQHDLRLSHVDVTKFDGLDPTGWVTQMEHYFSLYGITYELVKLWCRILHLNQERSQWRKNARQGYVAWTHFVAELYERFDTDTNHLGRLQKLKQSDTVEDFIAAFERLAFRTEGMFDAFF